MTAERTWLCYVPGYRILNRVAIYGGGHHTAGSQVFKLFTRYREAYPESGVWLEYGPFLSYENRLGTSEGPVVTVAPAGCTGLE